MKCLVIFSFVIANFMMLSGQVSSAISISNNVAESWLLGQYDSATLPIQTYAANSESLSQYFCN